MKQELLEYHRKLDESCRHQANLSFTSGRTKDYLDKAAFHQRAVDWMEGLQDIVVPHGEVVNEQEGRC